MAPRKSLGPQCSLQRACKVLSTKANPHLGPESQQGSGASWNLRNTLLHRASSMMTTLFFCDFRNMDEINMLNSHIFCLKKIVIKIMKDNNSYFAK